MNHVVDLFREFACRCKNKDLCLGFRNIDALKCGDRECASLTSSRLGLRNDVAFLDNRKNRFLLNMARILEAVCVYSTKEVG